MLRALRTAALGMSAQQNSVDNTANNLANANTTGFKRSTVVFQDLLYQSVQRGGEGEQRPAALQLGTGAAVVATQRTFLQGTLTQTGNSLDLGINGEGFLQARRPDGTIVYTRDGTFTLEATGRVVTQSGLTLEPDLEVPPETQEIQISGDGIVRVRLQDEPEPLEIGQIEVAQFSNPAGLRSIGGNFYEQTEASGEPQIGPPAEGGAGLLQQGFLEASNVDVVQEMVDLITAQRAYEMNSKMITTSEEMLQIANGMKR